MGKSKLESNIRQLDYDKLAELVTAQSKMSYKQLCKELKIPYLSGNSKYKQLNELATVCDFEKHNGQIILKALCSREELTLFNNRSVYLPYIEIIILNILAECEKLSGEDMVFTTYAELLYNCNMINSNYKAIIGNNTRRNSVAVAKREKWNQDNFYDYFDKSYNNVLKPIIKMALESISKRKRIDINKAYTLYSVVYRNGNPIMQHKDVTSTSPLGKELFKIESEAFKDLGLDEIKNLYKVSKERRKEFYELCNAKLREKCEKDDLFIKNKWDFMGYYSCLALTLDYKTINYDINKAKYKLNNKIQERLLSTISLDFLTNRERKIYIEATIDKEGEKLYDFKNFLREHFYNAG